MRRAVRDVWRLMLLARFGWPRLLLAALLGVLATGSGVGLMAVAAWLIARASEHPPVLALEVAVVAVRAFSLTRGLARYAERLVGHDAVLRVLADLRGRLVERLEPLAPGGLVAFRNGDLLARLVADVDAVQDLYLRVLLPPLVAVVVGSGAVALVGWLLPVAGLVLALGLLVVGVGVPALTGSSGRRQAERLVAEKGRLAAEVLDALSGSRELIAYGAADAVLARIGERSRHVRDLERSAARVAGVGGGLAWAVQGVCVVAVLTLGVGAARAGSLPVVGLAVLVLTALSAFDSVAPLPVAAQQLSRVLACGRRLLEVFDQQAPVTEPSSPVSLTATGGRTDVQVRDLGVSYPGSTRSALRALDLDLPPGRRVAILGESGAGKSTLVAALLRLVQTDTGDIQVGGVDASSLGSDDVRTVIGACLQDAYVFDTTIRENLLLARREATEDDLQDVVRRVGLDSWVELLPLGLDTQVGRNGALVSGGQRQRLSLARALLAGRPVLLLDEPTAGVDPRGARDLLRDLMAAAGGRSVLLVTHDPVGLDDVDEILLLHDGQVVDRGALADLLAHPGPFRDLWSALHATSVR